MSLYLLMGILPLALQVGCAVHALKTGRSYYWLWIILFFPAAGALVYFFVEVLPELRHGSAFDGASSGLFRAIHPERELTRLKDQLEICDSHANRVALAQEYVRLGQFDAAIPLFRRSLTGLYKDDPDALFGLAEACFLGASYAEARQILDQLMRLHAGYKSGECRLLLARILECSHDVDSALKEYESQIVSATGQEAKCRYALLLKKIGQIEKANALFEQILKAVSRSPRYYRKTQSQWVETAKKNLAEKVVN